jgi:hypothetical protein
MKPRDSSAKKSSSQKRRSLPVITGYIELTAGDLKVEIDDDAIIQKVTELVSSRRDEFRGCASAFEPEHYPPGYLHERAVSIEPDNLVVVASEHWEEYLRDCVAAARECLPGMKRIFAHAYCELVGTLEIAALQKVNAEWAKRYRYEFTASQRASLVDAQRVIAEHFIDLRYPREAGHDVRAASPWPPILLARFAEYTDRLLPLWRRVCEVKKQGAPQWQQQAQKLPAFRDELKPRAQVVATDLLASVEKSRVPIQPKRLAMRHAHGLLEQAWPSDRGGSDRTLREPYNESRVFRAQLDELANGNFE